MPERFKVAGNTQLFPDAIRMASDKFSQIGKKYRIGDFARYLGVTPDFLKHYEENGLLEVQHASSGYRWYDFNQSHRILEYARLRSYGVSVKDMKRLLSADDYLAVKLLDERAESLMQEKERIEAVLEEHRRLKTWCERRRSKPIDWEVRDVARTFFLPHSSGRDFYEDERIYADLKNWVARMPVVKSALRIAPANARRPAAGRPEGRTSASYSTYWGLIVRESIAKRLGIPIHEVAIEMPPSKAFVYHFIGMEKFFDIDLIAQGRHPMFEQMRKLGLQPAGDFYLVVAMRLTNGDGTRRGGSGRFIVPLAEAS